ncbi:glycosyltransferase family 2 protein [Enterobacteriaceae bacterium C34A]
MNTNVSVDIVLATHNGAKFIAAQIDSILSQSHQTFNLIISDDGSSDETIDIVNLYTQKDSRVSVHFCQGGKGVIENFNNGIRFSRAQYILFSDQDDVWEKNKVELLLNEITSLEVIDGKKVPCLGFSNLKVVNEELGVISNDFYKFSKLNPENNTKLNYLTWRSSVYGCTTIMNSELLQLAGAVPDKIAMHDHWYAFQAALHGKVFYLPIALINYRQHSANVVGAHQRSLSARLKRTKKTIAGIRRSVVSARMMLGLTKINDTTHYVTMRQRIAFFINSILPYYSERPAYTTIFSILWLING